MSLTVYTGNRMELLVDQLGELLSSPLGDPFTSEVIVVQSKGMQRWLAMELARRFGVWGNCSYPFPNKFINDLFKKTMPDLAASELFEPTALLWRVMGLLKRFQDDDAFAELKGYLHGASPGLKLYQLAGKVADIFDQYTIFRNDLLVGWQAGRDDGWQPALWRALVSEIGDSHRGILQTEFLRQLADGRIGREQLPERVTVFGISSLPLFHLRTLTALATHTEVSLFVMSPCRQYWGDIMPERTRLKLPLPELEGVDEGNPLLASLGRLGRDFSNLILECGELSGGESELYLEAPGGTLLADLQNSILNLSPSDDNIPKVIDSDDRTIVFHSCHSAIREVEVLHDSLLDLFAHDRKLRPRDILVMTPDIEAYAPYISAVFDAHQGAENRIPYSIADRAVRCEGRLARAFLAILELSGKRFSAPDVVDILSCPAIRRKFGMQESDLDQVAVWIEGTTIRWGLDETERQAAGVPPYRDHSWMAGLDRLLLGYAMPLVEDRLFEGVLPYDDMEGSAPLLLGRLTAFVRGLHQRVAALERRMDLAGWQETLQEIFQNLFAADDDEASEAALIGSVISSLDGLRQQSGFAGEVGLEVIRAWLRGRLDTEERGFGFLAGGVTFCAMLPMRSIPFRVIAMIGMNDGAFPRQNRAPGFDLISRFPRPGDRSLRDEDRYLFLEALLSARERLYISYVGQSISDNSIVPPSVLVSELLDHLERNYRIPGQSLDIHLITRHRLQPFSADYFNGKDRLFSYSRENCEAVAMRLSGMAARSYFIATELSEPPDIMRSVPMASLLAFFMHPVRFLLRSRLGIMLDDPAAPLEEREPFEIAPLDAYAIRQQTVERLLSGGSPDQALSLARGRGMLPPARPGDLAFARTTAAAVELAGSVSNLRGGEQELEPLDFDLPMGVFRLHGRLGGLYPSRMLRWRCSRLGAKDQLSLWIEHLLLNRLAASGYPTASTLVMSDRQVELPPVAESEACLLRLLELFWQGQRLPLRFFPAAALKYAETGKLEQAQSVWEGGLYPEGDDQWYRLCFGDETPLDASFRELADTVWGPYLRVAQREKRS